MPLSFKKTNRFLLFLIIIIGTVGIGSYYWFHQSTTEPIYPYNPAQDRTALVAMFTPNAFWLSDDPDEKHAVETFEYNLDHRSSSRSSFDEGNMTIYVYRDDEATKGFVSYYPTSWSVAKILYIVVDDKYRRRGYAEKLMQYALDAIKQKGFKRVELVTRVINKRAQGLYKKFGFKQGWDDGTLVSFERTL